MLKKIGAGSFAKVMLCEHMTNNQKYAIKTMNKIDLLRRKFGSSGRSAYDAVIDELKVLK